MLSSDKQIFIASANGEDFCINPAMGNRHGLIAGATGTGKTVTLQNLTESFSALGVPVFLTDVKGDLSGLSQTGAPTGGFAERIESMKLKDKGYANQPFPVCFWDVNNEKGHPIRSTVASMGPLLFSRLLDLNDVQSGIMQLIFKIADDQGLLLLDLKDLRSMTTYVGENRKDFLNTYGNISTASIGAIQRGLLRLEQEGGDQFFGEPSLRIEDLLINDLSGKGMVHILSAEKLMQTPRLYSTMLLWLLSDLYEQMPEVGDQDKPRFVLMFDEAHLIFSEAPPVLLQKMEQVVRLIRSKGVGVYFITQNPADIPATILTQLGNRVQHALRAYTPQDQKAIRAAAQTFRENPAFKTEDVITELATGEALISFLDNKGRPGIVQKALILPPESFVGAITDEQRNAVIKNSRMAGRYDTPVDRESAYERLAAHFNERQEQVAEQQKQKEEEKRLKEEEKQRREEEREAKRQAKENPDIIGGILGTAGKQVTRTISTTIGRQVGQTILRGILGGIFGSKK